MAAVVYEALLPWTTAGPGPEGSRPAGPRSGEETRDPTRPFRWPLLAPVPGRRARAESLGRLTDAEAGLLLDSARTLLDSDRPSEAISLLEDGVERAVHDPALQLRLRHLLGAALFYAGEYTRAAAVLDAAGHDYRRYFPPDDPAVLDCAYHAGHAYAETGKPGRALPQLRFYVQNAGASAGSAGGDEAHKILETRFVIAQLLAADGYPEEALAELQAVRPLLAEAFGPDSTQVRNLDKQAARLRTPR
jgi:tetratricopeptide (TPR) repeat protein